MAYGLFFVQIHTLKAHDTSEEERRNFEYGCLGEVRMLQAVKDHPCIVGIYGHQMSAEWDSEAEGKKEYCLLKSMIFMEYVKGGSLKVNEHMNYGPYFIKP